jgi:hypothetical protein
MVQLLREVVILVVKNPNMVIECINLYLECTVAISERRVGVTRTIKLFALNHYALLDLSDLSLQILYLVVQVVVLATLIIVASLDVRILAPVTLLQPLKVLKLVAVVRVLTLQLANILLHLGQLVLFIRDVITFLVDDSLQIVDLSKRLRNVILKASDLRSHLYTFLAL